MEIKNEVEKRKDNFKIPKSMWWKASLIPSAFAYIIYKGDLVTTVAVFILDELGSWSSLLGFIPILGPILTHLTWNVLFQWLAAHSALHASLLTGIIYGASMFFSILLTVVAVLLILLWFLTR